MNKELEFYKLIGGLAIIYGKELSKEAIQVYFNALSDMSIEDFRRSTSLWLNSPTGAFFPTPGQLKATLSPSDDQLAREAVSRIIKALSSFGGADNREKAKNFIGELGWSVVSREGGWEEVCKIDYANLRIAQAQWREYAASVLTQSRLGVLDKPPGLSQVKNKELQRIGEYLPSLKQEERKT